MAETLLFQGVAVNPENGLRVRLGHNEETLSDTKTLTPQDAQFQVLDAGTGGNTVVLPAEEASQGLFFVFNNNSAGSDDLTIEDDNGDEVTVFAQHRVGIVACDGSSWISAIGKVTTDNA